MATVNLRSSQSTPLSATQHDATMTNLNNDKLDKVDTTAQTVASVVTFSSAITFSSTTAFTGTVDLSAAGNNTVAGNIVIDGDIRSSLDSTSDLGTTGFRWANLFVDDITATTSVSVPAINTASGALTITPAAGSSLDIALSTTGNFTVNTTDLVVDTSSGNIGFGEAEPDTIIHATTALAGDGLTIESTDAGTSLGPIISLHRNSASPADNDNIGTINFDGEDSAGNRTTYARILAGIADVTNGTEDGVLVFYSMVAGTLAETMRLAGGNVGIGGLAGASTLKLYDNTASGIILDMDHTNAASPYGIRLDFSAASPDNNTNYFFLGQDSTTARVYIYSDGDLQNHDNAYGAISDSRKKQGIRSSNSQWDDIKNLRIRKYKMKDDGVAAKEQIGVVAQELIEDGMGGLVRHNKDNDEYGVVYSVLYMKAVKALQEALIRIENLEAVVGV